ncbi:hypothetical protein [Gallaecimonas sp. GXIMD4217]|uniref:hypothetical protein n=1 Tax=Gallaecimonas sp. GXIMD4217 TaxID=3131927 RepID=UPI00311B39F3
MRKLALFAIAGSVALMGGCASTPKPVVAQEKTVEISGKSLTFGGRYFKKENQLELTVNGDPVMKGRFPPYTPTQNLKADYDGLAIAGNCYFGSVLGSKGGKFGVIANIIQSAKSSSGDKCEILVDGKAVENLYF